MIMICNATILKLKGLGASIIESIDHPMAHVPEEDPSLYRQILCTYISVNSKLKVSNPTKYIRPRIESKSQ